MEKMLRTALWIATLSVAGCKPAPPSAEYLAVCEGPPLRSIEQREQAMQDGYEIDRQYDCITKRSAQAIAEQKAQWEAANTPEAKAAKQAEINRRAEEAKALREIQEKAQAQARAERERQWMEAEAAPIKPVEINSATELQLANLQGLSADVAHQIVTERAKGTFKDWGDVVQRVVGLSAAEPVVRASVFGLTVNGSSFEGAEPDSTAARYVRERWRRRNE